MTMPAKNRAEPSSENIKEHDPGEASTLKGPTPVEGAAEVEQAAFSPPSAPGRWGGRVILGLQKVIDKMLAGRIVQLQGQVIDQDRELSELTHDVGELTTQLTQMNRRLQDIDERLSRLEQYNKPPERG